MHTDYWVGRDQHNVVSDIDETMVKKFRQGKFADQTKEVKEAQLHAKLSAITSVSDEAILYWFHLLPRPVAASDQGGRAAQGNSQ